MVKSTSFLLSPPLLKFDNRPVFPAISILNCVRIDSCSLVKRVVSNLHTQFKNTTETEQP